MTAPRSSYLPRTPSLRLLFLAFLALDNVHGLAPNLGCAAKPAQKKKIAVAGVGGYSGACTFGYLQRAAALYGTGVGAVRALGATADSASRLNAVLSKHFCLAFADESLIKLTNLLESPLPDTTIAAKLQGWDALILGTNVGVSQRTVTLGTYEKNPNDKTMELYWPAPDNLRVPVDDKSQEIRQVILSNLIDGAVMAGVQHIVLVDDALDDGAWQYLDKAGVPYTCLRPTTSSASAPLSVRPNYTYRVGVNENLLVEPYNGKQAPPDYPTVHREDLAALAVQSLLTLDWSTSRCLQVTSMGIPDEETLAMGPKKRPDQEWCANSFLLQQTLQSGVEQNSYS